jgi:hypothetical protein
MALVVGTNSYVSVAEADSYFEHHLNRSSWISASLATKTNALITATRKLDDYEWTGVAVSDMQHLAFPRTGEYYSKQLGTVVYFENETPKEIKVATYELALHLINNTDLLESTSSVREISVGPITLKGITNANVVPSSVKANISALLKYGGAKSWWRAN